MLAAALTVVSLTAPTFPGPPVIPPKLAADYNRTYKRVATRFGKRTPGRHLVRHGLSEGVPASPRHVRRSLLVMRRWLNPPVVASSTSVVSSLVRRSTGGGGPERFVQCESGGRWDAVNKGSGAYGRYQLMPLHWQRGVCRGLDVTGSHAAQTQCANRVYESQGPGAWSQCGG